MSARQTLCLRNLVLMAATKQLHPVRTRLTDSYVLVLAPQNICPMSCAAHPALHYLLGSALAHGDVFTP